MCHLSFCGSAWCRRSAMWCYRRLVLTIQTLSARLFSMHQNPAGRAKRRYSNVKFTIQTDGLCEQPRVLNRRVT